MKVELHEKRLLITFPKQRVRKCLMAPFNAVLMQVFIFCRIDCQFAYLCTKFSKTTVELKKKKTPWKTFFTIFFGKDKLVGV